MKFELGCVPGLQDSWDCSPFFTRLFCVRTFLYVFCTLSIFSRHVRQFWALMQGCIPNRTPAPNAMHGLPPAPTIVPTPTTLALAPSASTFAPLPRARLILSIAAPGSRARAWARALALLTLVTLGLCLSVASTSTSTTAAVGFPDCRSTLALPDRPRR